MLGDFSARVLSVEDDAAIVDSGDAIWPGDEDTHITQHIFSCDPTEIANQLNAFWLPIWRKFSDGRLTTRLSRLAVYLSALSDASCHFDWHDESWLVDCCNKEAKSRKCKRHCSLQFGARASFTEHGPQLQLHRLSKCLLTVGLLDFCLLGVPVIVLIVLNLILNLLPKYEIVVQVQ